MALAPSYTIVIGYQPTGRLLVVAYFDSALLRCLFSNELPIVPFPFQCKLCTRRSRELPYLSTPFFRSIPAEFSGTILVHGDRVALVRKSSGRRTADFARGIVG